MRRPCDAGSAHKRLSRRPAGRRGVRAEPPCSGSRTCGSGPRSGARSGMLLTCLRGRGCESPLACSGCGVRRLRRPSERGTGGYVRRPYQVYDEVDESLPAGVGGPPVEITVRRPGEEPEPAPPAAPTAEATETSSRRRRRADAAVAASAATTVSRRAGPRQITVRRPTRPDVATRRQALADPTPRKVTRPRSVRPRGPR